MLRVVVTQRIDYIKLYNETRESIDIKLSDLIIKAGFLVFPISNNLISELNESERKYHNKKIEKWLKDINPDALILSGGNDIGEYTLRDNTENYLLDWAKVHKKPVLGICRGMQVMHTWASGTLEKIEGHIGFEKKLKVLEDRNNFPKVVNSFHQWSLTKCPDNFRTMAVSEDGIIKAIKHNYLPWEGWMWHPERDKTFSMVNIRRIQNLFNV